MRRDVTIQNLTDTLCHGLKVHIFTLHNLIQFKKEVYENDLFYNNERFFQYLSITSLVQDYDCRVCLDVDLISGNGFKKRLDLQMVGADKRPLLIAEYKRWWSTTGRIEIRSFKDDIEALRKFDGDFQKAFIAFTIQPKNIRDHNIDWLASELSFKKKDMYFNGFDLDKERCFDIISFRV